MSGVRAAERYAAPSVVLAAGAWSGRLAGLPRPVSVEPLRGQMISAPWPAGVPRAIVYRDDAYALERGGEMIVGATREFVGFDAGTTPSGIAELTESMRSLGPALAGASPTRAWAGLRPVTPDGLPIIGAEPRLPGLWYATGHGRNGILLAAVTGTAIRQLLDGHETIEQLAPINSRFVELRADRAALDAILRKGAEQARALAAPTLESAYAALGLVRL